MPPARSHRQQTRPTPLPPSPWYGLILILLQMVVIGAGWFRLPPQIPLFYSLPYGFPRLASKPFLFVIPALSLMTWILSVLLKRLKPQSGIYGHIHFWITQLALLLFTISLGHIVLIVL